MVLSSQHAFPMKVLKVLMMERDNDKIIFFFLCTVITNKHIIFWFCAPHLKFVWITLHIRCTVTAWGLKDQRWYLAVSSFLSTTVPRLHLGPTQHPVKWVLWSRSPGDKVDGVWRWWFTWSMLRSVIYVAIPQATHMPSWHDIRFRSGTSLRSPLSQVTVTFHIAIYYSQYEQS
jgi:hypothetical protein